MEKSTTLMITAELSGWQKKNTGNNVVEIDPAYFRPAEVELLIGDPTKAKEKIGWEPKVKLPQLVKMMVKSDLKDAEKEMYLKNGGYEVKNYYE